MAKPLALRIAFCAKGPILTNFSVEAGDAAQDIAAQSAKPPPAWLLILVALLLGAVLSYTRAISVWQKGTFFDSDDAMRMVELRAFLHGQGWFDLTAYRLDPPHGVFMHWSRLIDLPLAALMQFFSAFLPETLAERATRLAFPLLLQSLLYLGMARIASLVMGRAALIPILVLTLLSGMEVGQFQPGRIHHSAPQIMLLIFMVGGLVAALDARKFRQAGIAATLAALSLAVGLESLPFIILLAALIAAFWIWRGEELRASLGAFALGLGTALPLVYVVTVGPAHWFDEVCDALSPVYLVPGFVGALALGGLAAASPRLPNFVARLAAACAAAVLVLAAACAIRPVCFIDPYHGIDPLVRQIWLNNVVEGFSLPRLYRQDKGAAIMLIVPIVFGLVATLIASLRTQGMVQQRLLVILALSLAATALSVWMIRLLSFAALISLFGPVFVILSLRARLAASRISAAAPLAFCLVLPFSTIGWALVIPSKSDKADWHEGTGCLTTSAFVPLAALPKGLVAAPIDSGSHFLALTPHSVIAAPYHRNNDGNRTLIDAMLAKPAEAHAILLGHHVTYLMTCAGQKELDVFAARSPQGLAATLKKDAPPTWLQALPTTGPYHAYVIAP